MEPDERLDGAAMPLMQHLMELRRRLIWSAFAFLVAFIVCFTFANSIFDFLVRPLAAIWDGQPGQHELIFTALQEKFLANVKIGAFGGFILAFPAIAYQLWRFVAPGLYQREKRAFLPFLIAAPLMFLAGGSFVYFVLIPNAFRFFTSFEQVAAAGTLSIKAAPKVSEYLGFIMQLILGFGVSFELPVILTLLIRAELVETATLSSLRRYAYLIVTILAAVLTPADPGSMLAMAIPLALLFEASIVLGRAIEYRRTQ
jgi:sec-independent protein translocase protein TatC